MMNSFEAAMVRAEAVRIASERLGPGIGVSTKTLAMEAEIWEYFLREGSLPERGFNDSW